MFIFCFVYFYIYIEFLLVDLIICVLVKLDQVDLKKVKQVNLFSCVVELKLLVLVVIDLNNLFVLVKFYKVVEIVGIKLIVGVDIMIVEEGMIFWCMILFCCDCEGYLSFFCLLICVWMEGYCLEGGVVVYLDWFKVGCYNLFVLVGCDSLVGCFVGEGCYDFVEQQFVDWQCVFGDGLYLELICIGCEGEEVFNQFVFQVVGQCGLFVVVSNDVCFLQLEDFSVYEVCVCIFFGCVFDDFKCLCDYSDQQYFKFFEEMCVLFVDIFDVIDNMFVFVQCCNVEMCLGIYFLFNYLVLENEMLDSWICSELCKGLDVWLEKNLLVEGKICVDYVECLEFEFVIIIKMGFFGYFLIVVDFIQWGKNQGILIGFGCGFGVGLLVVWVLQIIDFDLILYNLLFEWFFNFECVLMFDFDIDFCMDCCDEVIDYVVCKYGCEWVSQIIIYGMMVVKVVVCDFGCVFGFLYGLVDGVFKLILNILGILFKDVMGEGKDLEMVLFELIQCYQFEDDVCDFIDLVCQFEDFICNVGKYVGGVVIVFELLVEFCLLFVEYDEGGCGCNLVIQFDKNDVEEIGLVKFDFFGLCMLIIIDWVVKVINKCYVCVGILLVDIIVLLFDDVLIYKDIFVNGNIGVVFQFEFLGMCCLLKDVCFDCFEDLIVLVLLYWFGLMDLIFFFNV